MVLPAVLVQCPSRQSLCVLWHRTHNSYSTAAIYRWTNLLKDTSTSTYTNFVKVETHDSRDVTRLIVYVLRYSNLSLDVVPVMERFSRLSMAFWNEHKIRRSPLFRQVPENNSPLVCVCLYIAFRVKTMWRDCDQRPNIPTQRVFSGPVSWWSTEKRKQNRERCHLPV